MKRTAKQAGLQDYRRRPVRRRKYVRKSRASVRMVKIEKKGMDTIIATGDIVSTTSTNGNAYVLNLVRAGTGSWNRIGRKIKPMSLRITGYVLYDYTEQTSTLNLEGTVLRMVIVYDKQPSGGTIPTFETIFGTTQQDGTEATTVYDPIKYDTMSRFRVLKDCRYNFNPQVEPRSTGTQDLVLMRYSVDEYIKLALPQTVYSGESTPMTIADINTGAIYLYARVIEQTNQMDVSMNLTVRLRYTDV